MANGNRHMNQLNQAHLSYMTDYFWIKSEPSENEQGHNKNTLHLIS